MGGKKTSFPEKIIYICHGSKCYKRGGKELEKMFEDVIKENDLRETVEVIITECTDRCKLAPIIAFQPDNVWLTETNEREAFNVFKTIMTKES